MADELLSHAQGHYFVADTGYDANLLIERIRAAGFRPVIPNHPTRKHRRRRLRRPLYRLRYQVEVFFHRLKAFRRAATRYEKTAVNYLGFLQLICAVMWLN